MTLSEIDSGLGQVSGGLAEINLTGRADAFDVSPVGREIQVGFKNFALRVMPLQFERANNLNATCR